MAIFNDTQKKCLDFAQRLYEIGETENARLLCVNCVSKAAESSHGDVLQMFYGANAYASIVTVADAVNCITLAKALIRLMDTAAMKGPANDSMTRWAVSADVSNAGVKDFFKWLSAYGRTPNIEDRKHIKSLYSNITRAGAAPMNYEMSDRVALMPLTDIIKGVLNGRVRVNGKGALE